MAPPARALLSANEGGPGAAVAVPQFVDLDTGFGDLIYVVRALQDSGLITG